MSAITLNLNDYLTVPKAAKALQVNEETIRRNIRSSRLKAEKIGTQWFIQRQEFSIFVRSYVSQRDRNTYPTEVSLLKGGHTKKAMKEGVHSARKAEPQNIEKVSKR
jgi:excisionase family DNA binding protein